MYLDKIKQQLQQLGLVKPDEFVGCTTDELNRLEEELGISLPKSYQEFMLWMGNGAGQFLRGSDCFFQHISYLREWAIELLEENNFPEALPDDAFIFFMHQGYQFSFFRLSEGDEPPIYYYCEGENKTSFTNSHKKFSDFLVKEIDIHAKQMMVASS